MAPKITRPSNLEFFCWGYIRNKIWDPPQPQEPITIQYFSATVVRECRNVSCFNTKHTSGHGQLIQMQNAALDIPSSMNNVICK